jgi:hypothetical protein
MVGKGPLNDLGPCAAPVVCTPRTWNKGREAFRAPEDSFEGPGFWASQKSVEVAANTVPGP